MTRREASACSRSHSAHLTSMPSPSVFPLDGGCDCRQVRYRMTTPPLFVHCCHCRWCQRESRRLVRAQRDDRGRPRHAAEREARDRATRRPRAAWGRRSPAVRVAASRCGATTQAPDRWSSSSASARSTSPIICRRTSISSRRRSSPGSCYRPGIPAMPEYYDREQHWPAESLERRKALLPRIEAYRAIQRKLKVDGRPATSPVGTAVRPPARAARGSPSGLRAPSAA